MAYIELSDTQLETLRLLAKQAGEVDLEEALQCQDPLREEVIYIWNDLHASTSNFPALNEALLPEILKRLGEYHYVSVGDHVMEKLDEVTFDRYQSAIKEFIQEVLDVHESNYINSK